MTIACIVQKISRTLLTGENILYICHWDFYCNLWLLEEHYPTTPYIHIFEYTYICVDICIHAKLIKYYIFSWLLPKSLALVILPLTSSVLRLFPEATCCQIKCPLSVVESSSQVVGQRCPRNLPKSNLMVRFHCWRYCTHWSQTCRNQVESGQKASFLLYPPMNCHHMKTTCRIFW